MTLVLKLISAVALGFVVFLLTGGSGILWAPGSGSGGNLIFTIIAFIFGWMLPTEIAFWKARKEKV